ncbi:kinase-like domain-containing protein [Xylariaceae sp. FL1272]|nr:kinase-like domain-containing protein [Xylariaceae sp. FL1272]
MAAPAAPSMVSVSPAPGVPTPKPTGTMSSSTPPGAAATTSVSSPNHPHPNPLTGSGPGSLSGAATSAPRPIPSSPLKRSRSGISLSDSLHPRDPTIRLTIPPADTPSSPSPSSLNTSSYCSSLQSPTDSLRRHHTDLTTPIPEECDEETCSESFPNEPVTPVSGRQSRDFRFGENHEFYQHQHRDSIPYSLNGNSTGIPEHPDDSLAQTNKDFLEVPLAQSAPAYHSPDLAAQTTPRAPLTPLATGESPLKQVTTNREQRPGTANSTRPPSFRRGSSALSRTMSAIFRRSNSHVAENGAANGAPTVFKEPSYSARTSETNLANGNKLATPMSATKGTRRFSFQRSTQTTRSNTPPSPGSPLEMAMNPKDKKAQMPSSADFFDNTTKKSRAQTGGLFQRVNFSSSTNRHPRRTRSVERKKKVHEEPKDGLRREPWAIPPDAGTGMKARRLSLSLPDDFFVDVAELLKEFEYQHKLLGRHGKHLGKGATSKVTLMVRKGCPGEMYAVKEFRSKSSSETAEEYEKKIKSEYSIAKSLHHPNVIETVRLCTDHGRWNHVMEYCSEGDLFSLVSKKYLKDPAHDVDRLCLFKQLCQGINYLHNNGIAHRDIKLENLLITKDSKLKITDFGVSEVFSGIHPGLRESGGQCGVNMGEVRLCKPGICGSLPYIAPEVLSKKQDYDPRPLDVWSSAVVMIYLLFGANLWEKAQPGLTGDSQRFYNDINTQWDKIEAKKLADPEGPAKDAYPKVMPFELFVKPVALRRLLLTMLHNDPHKRPTMNQVISGRWMKGVECCQPESYEDPVKFIDASKKDCAKGSTGKIFCHNHLPSVATSHGLPPMPGKPGY